MIREKNVCFFPIRYNNKNDKVIINGKQNKFKLPVFRIDK